MCGLPGVQTQACTRCGTIVGRQPRHEGIFASGLVALLLFQPLGLLALILGVTELRAIARRELPPRGRGFAIAGTLLGAVAVLAFVLHRAGLFDGRLRF